ncbi:DUF3108 domain-containing protein [Niveibacterium sp. SC-1]|uniref:DUF3108 domain-containing protein n=1 Tax=Niveibacterium sp. SC-1 TaxID=3135646 RepID=UPI00311EFEF7
MAQSRRTDRFFAWAIGLSLLVHALILSAPAWQVPLRQPVVRIEASLRKLPAKRTTVAPPTEPVASVPQAVAAKPTPRPAQAAQRKAGTPRQVLNRGALPAPAAVASSVETPSAPASPTPGEGGSSPQGQAKGPEAPQSEPVAGPPVTSDPAATESWPREGEIHYQVRYGEAMQVGEMVHRWSHDGQRYRMSETTRSVGLVRLFRKFDWKKESQGWVGREGLAPSSYTEDLNGKRSSANFYWGTRTLILTRDAQTRTLPLMAGAQDILSLAHQLAFLPDSQEVLSLTVVGGRWAEEASLSQVANERLSVPWGVVETRHFRCETRNGEYIIDIWLSREHRNAPVRVRVEDRKQGYVGDEIATDMVLDGTQYHFRLTPEEEELYKG